MIDGFSARYARQTLAITNASLMILETSYGTGEIRTLRRIPLAYARLRSPSLGDWSIGILIGVPAMSAKKPSFGMVCHIQPTLMNRGFSALSLFSFEAWLSRGLAVWQLEKREPRVPDLSGSHGIHPSNSPPRKIQRCNHCQEKELFQVAGPSHAVLELRNNFQFAFGCSGGDHSLRLYVVRYGLGLSCTVLGVQCPPILVISPASAASSMRCIKLNIELANSVYTCEYDMQVLHWPTVESANLRLSGIYIHIPRF
jgi:hypothetical protein